MKRALISFVLLVAFLALAIPLTHGALWDRNETPHIRPAYVAGEFYPSDPSQLRALLDRLLTNVQPAELKNRPVALIVPHAGYNYSGHVAAQAYAPLKRQKYKRVVIIAPSHLESFSFASIYNGDAYTTPLGEIPIDKTFAEKLESLSPLIKQSTSGHDQAQGRGEHALETQLPFLQQTLGDFQLVPIVMGRQNYDIERALGVALAQAINESSSSNKPDTLIVASSDLSHFHSINEALALDRHVLDTVANGDYYSLSSNLEQGIWEACGGGPIVAAMIAAERLGANKRHIMMYANSGDITGEKERVVGYGAATLYKSETTQANDQAKTLQLEPQDRETLLALAKASVETSVRQHKLPAPPAHLSAPLQTARGAFVTLKKNGELRGCIGHITPSAPLAETVRQVAALAALKDRRFSPVTPDELGQLDYEVSVLSPLRRVTNPQDIRSGRDGLLIRKGNAQGLLLPQVPIEQNWDTPTFLQQTSQKAGLPPNAWKDQNADLFAFSAIVISD